MQRYDIIHLEDDPMSAMLVEIVSRRSGFTYRSVGTLHGLKELMESGARAGCYIVDGSFPRGGDGCGGQRELLAPEAVDYIKENCGSPVIVHSGHDSLEDMGLSGHDVVHVRKDGSMQKLIEAVGESIITPE